MEALLAGLEGSALASGLRFSRFSYAAVSATHIFGIALLIGGIVPLDLRLLGAWPKLPCDVLIRVLVPVAAAGLVIAVLAGGVLFSIRATDYAALNVVRVKLLMIGIGTGSALLLHLRHGMLLKTASPGRLRAAAALSLTCWLGALIAGRLIAFLAD
jgi:hypothetical protein